jgi:nucleoside 2-deoxyribosyltransferase
MRTIYLAGPEVFLPDAHTVMAEKRRLAREHGFEPTGPGSDEATQSSGSLSAAAIYERNEAAMRRAEICLANVTPFRGVSADVGTAHEIGFMMALGRTVWAYTNDPRDYAERVRAEWPGAQADEEATSTPTRGRDGLAIEAHGLADNLMIHAGIQAHGGRLLEASALCKDPARDLSVYRACLRELGQLVRS